MLHPLSMVRTLGDLLAASQGPGDPGQESGTACHALRSAREPGRVRHAQDWRRRVGSGRRGGAAYEPHLSSAVSLKPEGTAVPPVAADHRHAVAAPTRPLDPRGPQGKREVEEHDLRDCGTLH